MIVAVYPLSALFLNQVAVKPVLVIFVAPAEISWLLDDIVIVGTTLNSSSKIIVFE